MFPYILEKRLNRRVGRDSRAAVDAENATAAADGRNRSKFSVRDFGMSICEPADILRGSVLGKNPDASNARVSLSRFQSLLLRAPERGQFDSLGHC